MLLGESLTVSLAVLMLGASAASTSGRLGAVAILTCFGGGIALLLTRPSNVPIVIVVLLLLAVTSVPRRLDRRWTMVLMALSLLVGGWSVVSERRAERFNNRDDGGYAMNRSYYRGAEQRWIAMERSAGRPNCAVFEEASRQPVLPEVEPTWRKYEATKSLVPASCPELLAWLKRGGLTPIEAIRQSPIDVVRMFLPEAEQVLSAPDYVRPSTTPVDDLVRHPLSVLAFFGLGLSLRLLDKRTVRLSKITKATLLGSVALTCSNALLVWLSDPMEPARHSLPWTLLVGPAVMTLVVVAPNPACATGGALSAPREN